MIFFDPLAISGLNTKILLPQRLYAHIVSELQSHKVLARDGWPDFVFSFHDNEEIGPKMLARIARRTGLTPDDL